jgi:hypothetical protein
MEQARLECQFIPRPYLQLSAGGKINVQQSCSAFQCSILADLHKNKGSLVFDTYAT